MHPSDLTVVASSGPDRTVARMFFWVVFLVHKGIRSQQRQYLFTMCSIRVVLMQPHVDYSWCLCIRGCDHVAGSDLDQYRAVSQILIHPLIICSAVAPRPLHA